MGVGGYAMSLTIRYLGSDVSLCSGFNCHKIKMDLREIVWCVMDWIDVTKDGDQWRDFAKIVMKLQVL
jgi:hypothetical protein